MVESGDRYADMVCAVDTIWSPLGLCILVTSMVPMYVYVSKGAPSSVG